MQDNKQKKQKLLIVTDFFHPHWTGLSKSLYYVLDAVDSDINCTVLTVRISPSLKKKDTILHTTIIREDPLITISRAKYSAMIIFRSLFLVPKMDAIVINSPCTNIVPVALIARLFGKKLFIFHQGDLILPNGLVNKFLEKVFDISSYIAMSLADKVSTYTLDYATHSRILQPFLSKCTPLLFPLSEVFYKNQSAKKETTKNITFGFAGRFVEEKGFDILFQAIPLIKKKIPNAKFLYAGESMPYENFYAKHKEEFGKVANEVQFLGLLNEKQLVEFYKMVDFMIIPSRSDCFNLVQAEAMLLGTPCISTNIPGLRYLIKKTGFGMLFELENPVDLAEKTAQAVANRKEILLSYTNVVKLLDKKANVKKIREFIEK